MHDSQIGGKRDLSRFGDPGLKARGTRRLMTVHSFVKGANTATHLRSPAKRKPDERSRTAAAPASAETVPRTTLRLPSSAAFQTKTSQPGPQPRKVNRFPIGAATREFYRL